MIKNKTLNIILVIISIITVVGLLAGIGAAFGSSGNTSSSSSNKKPSGGNTGNTTPPEKSDEVLILPMTTFDVSDNSDWTRDLVEGISVSEGDFIKLKFANGEIAYCQVDETYFVSLDSREATLEFTSDGKVLFEIGSEDYGDQTFELYKMNHSGYDISLSFDYPGITEFEYNFAVNEPLNLEQGSESELSFEFSNVFAILDVVFYYDVEMEEYAYGIKVNVYDSSTDALMCSKEYSCEEYFDIEITCDCRIEIEFTSDDVSMEVPGTETPIIPAEGEDF